MPRVPRSMSRVRPPVWRSRWKRSDSECRWRKTFSAIVRTARCVTFANTNSRSSVNAVDASRSAPYATSRPSGIATSGAASPAAGASRSTMCLSSTGTPTVASLAPIRKPIASMTRQR
jgi:hypothetical protein